MADPRIESAVQRIEAALARIAAVAEDGPLSSSEPACSEPASSEPASSEPADPEGIDLAARHERLTGAATRALAELDSIIGALER
ncbi:hypothetical protein GRI72_04580 [Altererythrobacter marinus]|uniref:Uncharacterized protein n=1 Tax=Pelagerythrobacter marinus TaxID=538382 RepID=A0ABW9UTD6_9SPHN|nr:hypothetical protein [Pelagerythrobacter marinus]MXO68101.1 hypothetical protein [Pelagerythrobacter marinus]